MVIVGSGLCGLSIASLAKLRGLASPTVLEKSRGVGGRLATRRTDTAKFDHGAQFLRVRNETEDLRKRWNDAGILSTWFEAKGIAHVSGREGMTSLAKALARDATVKLEHRVTKLERIQGGLFRMSIENQASIESRVVILTCPLPQSLEILRNSQIAYDKSLEAISYEKALVGLFEDVKANPNLINSYGYIEPESSDIFSIANQMAKGLSDQPAWTVTMGPNFSETNFDESDSVTLERVIESVCRFDPIFEFNGCQLKKWRYCRPTSRFAEPYLKVTDGLYLAGDAFGGQSLNGAVRSAQALVGAL